MKRTHVRLAVLAGLVAMAGAGEKWMPRDGLAAQAPTRSLPMFEVDRAWPKVPAKWKLGDPSSFAVDAQDNIWLLHRPRTLTPAEAAMAAPPVMVFDHAGKFIKAWGGAGSGYEWPEREHGIHIDHKGIRLDRRKQLSHERPAGLKPVADDQILKFTQDGKFVMQIGQSNQSKGNADTQNVHRAADVWVHPATNELFVADGYGNHRVVVFDADSGAFKRMWGAFGNKPVDDDHCEVIPPKTSRPALARSISASSMPYASRRTAWSTWPIGRTGASSRSRRTESSSSSWSRPTPRSRGTWQFRDPDQQFLYVGNGDDDRGRRSQGARDRGVHQGARHDRRRPPDRHRFEGQSLYRRDSAGLQKLTFKGKWGRRNRLVQRSAGH